MRSVFFASLRTHTRRYVAATIAVVASVAFVVVIGVITAGARRGLMDSWGAPFRNADIVVDADPQGEPLDTAVALEIVDRLGDNASGLGRIFLPSRVDGWQGDVAVGPVASAALRWQALVSGRFPERMGETAVHVWTANERELGIGDTIHVGEGRAAVDLRVVGLVEAPSPVAQASMYVTWPQYLLWRDDPSFHVSRLAVRGDPGPLPAGAAAYPPEEYVRASLARMNSRTDAVALLMLLLAGIAFSVSALVIANTFSILFAQRLRDFALLRCVGATRRQVVRSVRSEAAAVGVLASLTGVLVGVGIGYGLLALINTLAALTPMGDPDLPIPWLVGGFVVGLVVTMAASWLPTRRVVRVSPLAALRPDAAVDVHTPAGAMRLALAATLLAAGVALLAVAMTRDSTTLMLAGGGAVFTGILLVGPVIVPRLIRTAGTLLGPAGRLATTNAVRNPRRTATTTSSLLVGVTVLTAVLTGMATTDEAVDEKRNGAHVIDAGLMSREGTLTDDVLDRVRRTRGVEQAIAVDGVVAQVAALAEPIIVVAAPDAERVARDGGGFARLKPGTIAIDRGAFRQSMSFRSGDTIPVRVGEREVQLKVADDGTRGWGQSAIVAPETLALLTEAAAPHVVWVRASSGADSLQLVDDLDEIADAVGARVEDELQARATEERQLRILTWSVLGLVAVSVVIALIGIANTLGLSVLERTREHALLRALGLTRGQLRRMLAAEAVLLSVAATLIGTTLGVAFAWVGYETFVKPTLTDATMRIPWLSLGSVIVSAVVAGLLASLLPARRAARVTPVAGLARD